MNRLLTIIVLSALLLALAVPALAYPVLQLYIDGATYDPVTESWSITAPVFDLWILGNVAGPGGHGSLPNVHLVMSFFGSGGSVALTPTTTSVVTDPSTPPAPSFSISGTGSHPILPDHGIFNDPALNHWENWLLGNFTLTDSPTGDFITSFPSTLTPASGQINVYSVAVSGWDRVHFDAFGYTVTSQGRIKEWKAPFSHDSVSHPVPEPGALFLLASGLAGAGALAHRGKGDRLLFWSFSRTPARSQGGVKVASRGDLDLPLR